MLCTALALGKKLVSLASDTHNAWHSQLTLMGLANPAQAGMKVGEESATSSVSSPGLEAYLALPSVQVKGTFEGVVDDPKWLDPVQRGWLKMTFTATEARGEWVFVDTIASADFQASVGNTASYAAYWVA